MSISLSSNVITNKSYKVNIYNLHKKNNITNKNYKSINGSINYIDEIKNKFPNVNVNIKSMTASDVKQYYEYWKKQSSPQIGLKHEIIISPKVLDKMNNDEKYAKEMMAKIEDAAIPKGFGGAELLEYKVIVKDDGNIEVMACAYFGIAEKMSKKNESLDDDKRKKEDKINQLEYTKYIYEDDKLKTVEMKKSDRSFMPYNSYLYQNAMLLDIKNNLIKKGEGKS